MLPLGLVRQHARALLLAVHRAPDAFGRRGQLDMLHAEFGEHHYGRVDLELLPGQKARAIEYFGAPKLKKVLDWPVARREDLDGVKMYLGEIGWVMVRAERLTPALAVAELVAMMGLGPRAHTTGEG